MFKVTGLPRRKLLATTLSKFLAQKINTKTRSNYEGIPQPSPGACEGRGAGGEGIVVALIRVNATPQHPLPQPSARGEEER